MDQILSRQWLLLPLSFIMFTFGTYEVAVAALPGSSVAPAAPVKLSHREAALEFLSMPEKNREALVLTHKDRQQIGNDLLVIASQDNESMSIRWRALTLGALAKGQQSLTELEKALKNDKWFMRNAALLAIQRIFPAQAKKAALSLLQDKALVVRSAAVKVLSTDLNGSEREVLWEELDKKYNFKNKQSLWVRAQILEALALQPDKRELPVFARLLKDKDSRLHYFSILAMEKISDKKLGGVNSSLAEKRELWLKAKL